jgi:hypothetical protein
MQQVWGVGDIAGQTGSVVGKQDMFLSGANTKQVCESWRSKASSEARCTAAFGSVVASAHLIDIILRLLSKHFAAPR